MIQKITQSLQAKMILAIVIASFIVVMISVGFMFYLKNRNVELAGVTTAQAIANQIETLRTFYTNNVVTPAQNAGLAVNYDFAEHETTLPLPATLVKVLGEEIERDYPGTKIRLYSNYPFQHRIATEMYDPFEMEAISTLKRQPESPFYRLEQVNGRLSIRYAVADLMRPGCVDCHNTHPESPKRDWQVGDLRGVVEIIIPLDAIATELQTSTIILTIVMSLVLILMAVIILMTFRQTVLVPVQDLTIISEYVREGDFELRAKVHNEDELGLLTTTFNQMTANLAQIGMVARHLAQGDLSVEITPHSDKDVLGYAFKQMVVNLRKLTEENRKEIERATWQANGQTALSNVMRGQHSVPSLSTNVIWQLCQYLEAPVGALYLLIEDTLVLMGSYAYTSYKNQPTQFKLGEGLVGQAAVEKKAIVIAPVPDNYIKVYSGLGEIVPKNLLISPFIYEKRVVGVIELGSFDKFNNEHLEFIQKAMESVAIAFHTTQSRAQIEDLLAQAQIQTAKVQAQDEELHATNEALAAQTKNLLESEKQLKEHQIELETLNAELEEKATILQEKQKAVDEQNHQLKNAQEKLRRKTQELIQANKYKSEFLANVSHELRTPLNSLLILAHVLMGNEEGNLNETQIQSAKTIHESGKNLLALINEILHLAKLEAGQMGFHVESIPLIEIVDYVQAQFNQTATNKNLSWRVILGDNLPADIKTDKQQLLQIIKSLLNNAFKFTHEGEVRLKIYRPSETKSVSQSTLNPSQTIAFEIKDSGIGISPKQQNRIFEPFQQADGSISRKYEGTGLGLSLSRELAHKLGGHINLESALGLGSVFTLYLPEVAPKDISTHPQETMPNHNPTLAQSPRDLSITPIADDRDILNNSHNDDNILLIIENDPNFAQNLLDISHQKGVKCLIANTGQKALALANIYKPSAIMINLNLPDIDAFTLLDTLEAEKTYPNCAIIIYTEHALSTQDTQKLAKYGDNIIIKGIKATKQLLDETSLFLHRIATEKTPPAQQQTKHPHNKDALLAGKHILIIDADIRNAFSLSKQLTDKKMVVQIAQNTQNALDLLTEIPNIDLILMDVKEGIESINHIRAQEKFSQLPILALSTKDMDEDRDKCIAAGANDYLPKPIETDRLFSMLHVWLYHP